MQTIISNFQRELHQIFDRLKYSSKIGYEKFKKYIRYQLNEEKSFLSDTSLTTLKKPTFSSHLLLWGSAAFLFIAITWSHFAILDETTVGEGKVIPSRKIQTIQSLQAGTVENILVREGDIVEPNQILMHIDDTQFSSSYKEGAFKAIALTAKIARLTAEANGSDFIIPNDEALKKHPEFIKNEQSLFSSNKKELTTKVNTIQHEEEQHTQELNGLKAKETQLTKSLQLAQKELDLTKPLVSKGAASQVEVIRLERQVNDLDGELQSTKANIPKAEANIAEDKSKINELFDQFRSKAQTDLNQAHAELASLQQANIGKEDVAKHAAIRSPVKGTVKKINISTIGGVVQSGATLMEIVPLDDTLLIETRIRPSDIGFIHPGQEALVKITAYDFSIYGGIKGKVEQISADTIADEKNNQFYQIYVRTDKNHLGPDAKPLTIIPGMVARVDIKTGKKSVWTYLMKPIMKAKQNALTER